jgi:hypothetical protein
MKENEADEFERTYGSIKKLCTSTREVALTGMKPYLVPSQDKTISTTAFSTYYSYGKVLHYYSLQHDYHCHRYRHEHRYKKHYDLKRRHRHHEG